MFTKEFKIEKKRKDIFRKVKILKKKREKEERERERERERKREREVVR